MSLKMVERDTASSSGSSSNSSNKYSLNHPNRFIAKTYHIVDSDEPNACWVPGGKSFLILDVKKFSQTILPKYFKHCKFTSFVRQLNFYGFRKQRIKNTNEVIDGKTEGKKDKKRIQQMILGNNIVCFQHDLFQANRPDLLKQIQRSQKQLGLIAGESQPEKEVQDMKEQLQQMKEHMTNLTEQFEMKLERMKTELELDYLQRIKAVEVCYKDLANMVVNANRETEGVSSVSSSSSSSGGFPLPNIPQHMSSTPVRMIGGTPPLIPNSACSSSNSSRILLEAKKAAEQQQLAEQRIRLLASIMNNPSHLAIGRGHAACANNQMHSKNIMVNDQRRMVLDGIPKQLPLSMNGFRFIESFQRQQEGEQEANKAIDKNAFMEKVSAAMILDKLSSQGAHA